MKISNYEVCEGVKLTVIQTDKFKTDELSVSFAVPLKKETVVLDHLVPEVLSHCCKDYPTQLEFNIAAERLYAADLEGYASNHGEVQLINFRLNTINESFAFDEKELFSKALGLFSKMIYEPLLDSDGFFDKEIVEKKKKDLCDAVRARKNNKTRFASSRAVELLCEGEDYSASVLSSTEAVECVTAKDLKARYDEVLNSSPVYIYFVGALEGEKVLAKVKEILPFTPRKAEKLVTEVKYEAGEFRRITERMNIVQSKLCLGFRSGMTLAQDCYHNFVLFLELFGGSPVSKLFVNVREKMSLCYYCSPIGDNTKGIMIVSSGIDGKNREKAEKAILQQLEAIKQGDISDDEFESAKKSAVGALLEVNDDQSTLARWYRGRALVSNKETLESFTEKILKASKEDVVNAAKGVSLEMVYFLTGEEERA